MAMQSEDPPGCGSCILGIASCWVGTLGRFRRARGQVMSQIGPATEEEFRRRIDILSQVPLLKRLPRSQYPLLAQKLRARKWQPGEVVLEAGAEITEFSLIAQGHAEVIIQVADEEVKDRLRPGDYFGEKLLDKGVDKTSPARIVAVSGLVTLSITAAEFEGFGLRKHLKIPRRRALDPTSPGLGHPTSPGLLSRLRTKTLEKTDEEREFIADAVRANRNLRSLVELREEMVQQICDVAEKQVVVQGNACVHRGEYGGMFFIVESGKFELRLDRNNDQEEEKDSKRHGSLADITSEMRKRKMRKERFLQTLIHTQDLALEKGANLDSKLIDIPENGEAYPRDAANGSHPPRTPGGRRLSGGEDLVRRRRIVQEGTNLLKREALSDDECESPRRASRGGAFRQLPEGKTPQSAPPHSLRSQLEAYAAEDDSPPVNRARTTEPDDRRRSKEKSSLVLDDIDDDDDKPRRCSSWNGNTPKALQCHEAEPRNNAVGLGRVPTLQFHEADAALEERSKTPCRLGIRGRGDSFGELALLYNIPRTSTAVALEDSVVWGVSQACFRRAMVRKQQKHQDDIVGVLDQVNLFEGLLSHEKEKIAPNFLTETFKPDQWIVAQGERQNVWYILLSGECAMFRTMEGREEYLATFRPVQYFGERALLKDTPSEFSVKVAGGSDARLLVLDGPTFKELVGLLRNDPAFRHAVEDDLLAFAQYKGNANRKLAGLLPRLKQARSSSSMLDKKEKRNEFVGGSDPKLDPNIPLDTRALDRIGILGSGAYGIVTLERDRATQQLFALKTISKGLIVQKNLQDNVRNERELLTMVDSPFTIHLHATFKDENYLYFLFEPLLGGDLHNHLYREPGAFRQAKVYKFVVASMVIAFEHLHERNIVFRDLKPENILIDGNSYPKLCDFGFAKFVLGRAMTLCGTPEYVAPEVIASDGYDRMVDWWTLGILTYELLTQTTPFADEDEDLPPVVIFCNIKAGIDEVRFPFSDREPTSFIKSCCRAQPSRRLGVGGAAQVMKHQMLSSVNFDALRRLDMEAPYKPQTATPDDLSILDQEDAELPPVVPYEADDTGWDDDF